MSNNERARWLTNNEYGRGGPESNKANGLAICRIADPGSSKPLPTLLQSQHRQREGGLPSKVDQEIQIFRKEKENIYLNMLNEHVSQVETKTFLTMLGEYDISTFK